MISRGAMRPTRISQILPPLRGSGVLLAAATDADRIRQALTDEGLAIAEAHLGAGRALGGEPSSAGTATGPHVAEGDRVSADTLDADPTLTTMRAAQAAIAAALRLPETAGRNLDALVDSLRDLATWWPDDPRIVLLLHGAESLVDGDLPGWHTLTEILREASTELWRGGVEGDRAFETVALVDRHGVLSLPREPTPQVTTTASDDATMRSGA